MSPISTAQINPNGQTFCLSPPGNVVLVPILLNNTNPVGLRYSLTPLGYSIDEKNGKMEYVDLSAKDLKAIEQYRLDTLQLTRPEASAKRDADDYDEYDENEAADDVENPHSYLQKTQSLAHVRITKPGILRLERVVDFSNIDARLAYPSELTVVPCPRVEFVEDTVSTKGEDVRCAGQNPELELAIDIHGVPPLSLRWFKAVNGRREQFLVEGIDDGQGHTHSWSASEEKGGRIQAIPQDLRVPLAVSLDALGTHAYVLEEVVDGLGNVIPVGSESLTLMHPSPRSDTTAGVNSRNTRSFTVLRRPTMSFKYCGPGNPTSLLIGSEAFLVIGINEADASDAPWEITLQYQPLSGDDRGKRLKPWKKTMKSEMGKRELKIGVSTPGEYTIIGVRGKVNFSFCSRLRDDFTQWVVVL
jgi:nucleoporin POM152